MDPIQQKLALSAFLPRRSSLFGGRGNGADHPARSEKRDPAAPLTLRATATWTASSKMDTSAWAHAATNCIARADALGARVVGLSSNARCAGVSLFARELTFASARFGRRSLLVDVAQTAPLRPMPSDVQPQLDLVADTRPIGPLSFVVAPASAGIPRALDRSVLRASIDAALTEFDLIVLDLPPVSQSAGHPLPLFRAGGSACDTVFLICLTGEITSKELDACLQDSAIAGAKIGGVILNDWKVAGSRFLTA